jgi:hypothetical protein
MNVTQFVRLPSHVARRSKVKMDTFPFAAIKTVPRLVLNDFFAGAAGGTLSYRRS